MNLEEINEKTDKLLKELEELTKPLQKWLRENYDLMCSIVIDGYTAKVLRAEIGTLEYEEEKDE